jgi:PAS domain S-box-containing protein
LATESEHPNLHKTGTIQENRLFTRLVIAFGLLAVAISVIGIITARFSINVIGSGDYRTMAFSAVLIWIFLGSVIAYQASNPLPRFAGLVVQAVLVLIAVIETIEFALSIVGNHFFIETLFVSTGMAILGPSSKPISPAAAGFIVLAAVALVFCIRKTGLSEKSAILPDVISILGAAISLASITFVLSYTYGDPLLYGTQFIPIAFLSALAAFFIGMALIASAGPGAFPVRYIIGNSTSAALLRIFVPLVVVVILVENFVFVGMSSWFNVHDAVILSSTVVVFGAITALVVARVSGRIGRALEIAERELVRKNEDLNALNEELTATQEELRQTNDELLMSENHLMRKNDDLNALNEELTATQEELRQNIDELTRAETTLRESEERFRSITQMSPVQISIAKKSDGGILFTNPAYEQAFGFEPDELAGLKTPDLYHDPADRGEILKIFREKGYVAGHEVRVRRKDGTPFWVNVSLRSIRFSGHDALLAASIDITDRKRTEEVLRESQKENSFLADLLNRSEQPFGVGYPDGRLGIVNGAFERLVGYSGDELRTMDWATVLTPPEWREPEQKSLEKLHCTGIPVQYEKEYLRKDGSRVPIELLVHLVTDNEGNPLHYYSFITDITERKRAKEELIHKNEELGAINEELTAAEEELHQNIEELTRQERDLNKALAEKEVLLSEIHHRVKNNLTAFISLLSLEGSTEESPAGKMLKQDLQNRARSMALIHETLYRTHSYNEVDMGMYLETLLGQIANSLTTRKPVKTVIETHDVVLDIPRATPAGLIINELVTNSFKYAFPDSIDTSAVRNDPPTIIITLTKIDGEYLLAVKDNGVGLPPGFDITKTKTLGLKLVNFLAKHQMSAKIEVNSATGTEFIFRFGESLK